MKEKFFSTKNITVTAMLTAISFVLYLFPISIPFLFPEFLKIQFSDMPALIGGFMMGPIWGCVIIVLKSLFKLLMGSSSMYVGTLADLIVGIAFVLPASLLYQFHRTKKGAIVALAVGTAVAVVASLMANAFILIPAYSKLMGWGKLVNKLVDLFPSVTKKSFYLYYLPLSVLPFNVLRCLICALITFLVYKHLHKLINRMFAPRRKKDAPQGEQVGEGGSTVLAQDALQSEPIGEEENAAFIGGRQQGEQADTAGKAE